MAFSVQVNVSMLDALSPKLKKIERGFAKVGSVIDRSAEKMKKFGRAATSLGSRLSLGVTAPILALAAVSFRNFGIQADAIAQVEAGIASTGGTAGLTSEKLQELAISLQEVSVFGDEEILRGVTAQLLTFTNLTGPRFIRAQQAILDVSTKVGTDLTSTAIQLGKALNDPIANLGALGRVGIQFSEVQKELIKSLSETGQIAEAQSIILTELENQYGGAAQAAAAAGLGPFKQLINSMNDMTESFGGVIAEGLLPFVRILKPIVKAIESFPTPVKALIVVLALMVAALGPIIFFLGAATLALSVFTAANMATAVSAFVATKAFILMGIAAFASLGPYLPLVLLVGAALTALAGLIFKFWNPIKAFFAGLWEGFLIGFAPVIDSLQQLFSVAQFGFDLIMTLFGSFLDQTDDGVSGFQAFGKLVGIIMGGIATAIHIPLLILGKLIEGLKFVAKLIPGVSSLVSAIKLDTVGIEAAAATVQPGVVANSLLAPSKTQVNQNIQIAVQFDAAGNLISATANSDSLGETKIETVNLGQITPVIL